ncbi:MAG: tRNA 2-selenouridine(34) synthase MnmH [Bacilli bacterium]
MRVITYEEILENESKYIFVDVRTPFEYNNATIPESFNIPILDDNEYKIVGTIYKKEGRKQATKEALRLFGPKLLNIYVKFEELLKYEREIIIFCYRGGMRSTTIVNLLETLAIPVLKLDLGYKQYRKHVINNLDKLILNKHFVTLCGNTGVGKTEILYKLKYDYLDLEKYANHRGSILGHVGLGEQNSQKMFESYLYDGLRKTSKLVIVEGESRRIGKIILPNVLYDCIHNGEIITITTNIENRIKRIKDEYVGNNDNDGEIELALNRLRKYINDADIDEYINLLNNRDYDGIIKNLIEKYYDKNYASKLQINNTLIDYKDINDAKKR